MTLCDDHEIRFWTAAYLSDAARVWADAAFDLVLCEANAAVDAHRQQTRRAVDAAMLDVDAAIEAMDVAEDEAEAVFLRATHAIRDDKRNGYQTARTKFADAAVEQLRKARANPIRCGNCVPDAPQPRVAVCVDCGDEIDL